MQIPQPKLFARVHNLHYSMYTFKDKETGFEIESNRCFLLLDDNFKQKLTNLKKYAEEHPMQLSELLKIMDKSAPPAGEREGHVVYLEAAYRVVYSIEHHPQRSGHGTNPIRHLSVSIQSKSPIYTHPSMESVNEIAKELGFIIADQKKHPILRKEDKAYKAIKFLQLC